MLNKNSSYIRLIGRREFVNFPELDFYNIEAKIDTGAYTNSLNCENIELKTNNGITFLVYTICLLENGVEKRKTIETNFFYKKKIKNSFGELEERYIIKTLIKIGKKSIKTSISLSNRKNMRYAVLIGRKLLKGKFLIDVNQVHIGGKKIVL